MKTRRFLRFFASLAIIAVLIAAMALGLTACGKEKPASSDAEKTIYVSVINGDGETEKFTITTVCSNLKDALEQEKLIQGSGEGSSF